MRIEPIVTHVQDEVSGISALAIVFNYEQALDVFMNSPNCSALLCIDLDKMILQFCNSCAQAGEFYHYENHCGAV